MYSFGRIQQNVSFEQKKKNDFQCCTPLRESYRLCPLKFLEFVRVSAIRRGTIHELSINQEFFISIYVTVNKNSNVLVRITRGCWELQNDSNLELSYIKCSVRDSMYASIPYETVGKFSDVI